MLQGVADLTRYVLWSGGLDSTLLLHDIATSEESRNQTVNAVTIRLTNREYPQQLQEYKARKILRTKLPKNIKYYVINVDTELHGINWQMPYWLAFISPFMKNDDLLSMAYLSSDGKDFWQKRQSLIDTFWNFMGLNSLNAKIDFPFELKTKGYVIKELKKLKLLKYCWTCGEPKKGKPCGKCMKCISLKRWTAYPDSGVET